MTAGLLFAIVGGAGLLELAAMALAGWWAWRYGSPAKRKERKTQRDAREARIVGRITGNTPMHRILGKS